MAREPPGDYHSAMLCLKRIYDKASPEDGFRILVDRLWPRGISKTNANVDYWMRDVAPSAELRKWFGHDSHRWNEFKTRYAQELEALEARKLIGRFLKEHPKITLLYGAKDDFHNNAAALWEFLTGSPVPHPGSGLK